jgi:hypothetical protein
MENPCIAAQASTEASRLTDGWRKMKCHCGFPTVVKDGRYIAEGYWRRRECPSCHAVITTIEQVCQTVKGRSGHKPKEPVITVPKPPKVTVAKRRNAEKKPVIPKQKVPLPKKKKTVLPKRDAPQPTVKPAWMRIEELKELRELEKS